MNKTLLYHIPTLWNIAFVLMIFRNCGMAFSQDAESPFPIRDHRDAIEMANSFSGLHELPNVVITAEKALLQEDNTPLLHKQIVGRPLWKVTYANLGPELLKRNPYIQAFDVFVDAETGKVLKIASQWVPWIDPKDKTKALVSLDVVDKKLSGEDSFLIDKIPEEPPKVSFLKALKRAEIGKPYLAKRIDGIYILLNGVEYGGLLHGVPVDEPDKKIRPVWFIIDHGVPPSRRRGVGPVNKDGTRRSPGNPFNAYTRTMRIDMIDASTGIWLFGTETKFRD